jgi:hypothetical protein
MGDCLLLAVFEKYRSSLNFWATFSNGKKLFLNFDKKLFSPHTYWAVFIETHLVTLIRGVHRAEGFSSFPALKPSVHGGPEILEGTRAGLPDFSWCNIPKREKYTK